MEEIRIPWEGWVLCKKLGQGGFGAVYEIHREITFRTEKSALKVIRFPRFEEELEELQDSGMDDGSIRARFTDQAREIKNEYGIMAQLKGCTNVVYCDDLKEVTEEDGISRTLYIKMELLKPLTKAVRPSYDPEKVARAVGTDICKALIACEKENIVHRDIKPENIFVTEDGVYKLGDFGIARTMEKTMNGTKPGTFHFMAPEVYRGENYGKRVDIYSLGMVLYWLLNEKRGPFLPLPPECVSIRNEEEARRKRFSGEPLPPPKNGSESLKKIVLKACAFKPEDRFQNARAMLEALSGVNAKSGGACVLDRDVSADIPEWGMRMDGFGHVYNGKSKSVYDQERGSISTGGSAGNRWDSDQESVRISEDMDATVGVFHDRRKKVERCADDTLPGDAFEDLTIGIHRTDFHQSTYEDSRMGIRDADAIERGTIRSIFRNPQAVLHTDEIVCAYEFLTQGVILVDKAYQGKNPSGLSFADIEKLTGNLSGGKPCPGFMGIRSLNQLCFKDFLIEDGGIGRVTWMSSGLKRKIQRIWDELAYQKYGIREFCGMIPDETRMRRPDDPTCLMELLDVLPHPIHSMEKIALGSEKKEAPGEDDVVCFYNSGGFIIVPATSDKRNPTGRSGKELWQMAKTDPAIYFRCSLDKLISPDFMKNDGGICRIAWMPGSLKQKVAQKLNRIAEQYYGISDFSQFVADEGIGFRSTTQVDHFMQWKHHPALKMQDLMLAYP